MLSGAQGQAQGQPVRPPAHDRRHQPEPRVALLALDLSDRLVLGDFDGLEARPRVHHEVVEDDPGVLAPGTAPGRLVARLQVHDRREPRDQVVEDGLGQQVVAQVAGERVDLVGVQPGAPFLVRSDRLLPPLGNRGGRPLVQETPQLLGQRIAVTLADRLRTVGNLEFVPVVYAQRLLQGVYPVVDQLLLLQQPVGDGAGGRDALFPVDVGVGIDDPAAGELQQAVVDLADLPIELLLLLVGSGDGLDAAGDQRQPAVVVLHGGVPALLGGAHVVADHAGLEEGAACAVPFLGAGLGALLGVGVPRARIADGINVGELLSLAAEVGHHVLERVDQEPQPRVVQPGVDDPVFPRAELFVQAGHSEEQRGDVVADLAGPGLVAVAGAAPLGHVVLHLVGDLDVAAAQQQQQGLDLQLLGVALEQVGHLAPLDDLHLLLQRVGAGALALLGPLAAHAHPGDVEEVHLFDHLAPVVVEAVGQDRHHQLEHSRLDRLQLLVALAASRVPVQHEPIVLRLQADVPPIDVGEALRVAALVELGPLGVQQEADRRPVREDGRVVVAHGDLAQEVVDPVEQVGERVPVVPEQPRRGGDVAVLAQRVPAEQAVEHRFLGREAAPVHVAHVGERVQQVHSPLAVDFAGAIVARKLLEQVLQLTRPPGNLRRLAFAVKPAGQDPKPLGPGQRANHDRVLRRDAGGDAVLGRKPRDQGRGLVRAALGVQIVVEGEVLVVGGFAVLLVASQRAIGLAVRLEHLPDKKTLAHLGGTVDRRGHRHLGRGEKIAGQAAELQDLELVALGHRKQVLVPPGGVVLGQPIAKVGGQVLHPLRIPDQVPIAFVWECHEWAQFSA